MKKVTDKEFKKLLEIHRPKKIINMHIMGLIDLKSKQLEQLIESKNEERSEKNMKPLYVIHYTLFKNGGAFNRFRFFETKKQLDNFLKFTPWIKDFCIIFKNIDLEGEVK